MFIGKSKDISLLYIKINNDISLDNANEIVEAYKIIDELVIILITSSKSWLKIIKDYSGSTIEELVEISGLSKSTINRYLYEKKKYDKYTIIRLLLATKCPPEASYVILEKCNCRLDKTNKNDILINYIICYRWFLGIDENLKILNKNGIYI